MLSKLWFFYKQSFKFKYGARLTFKGFCQFRHTYEYHNSIKEPIIGSSKCTIHMSVLPRYRKSWYMVLAHEIGHLLDIDSVFGNDEDEGKLEYLFAKELKAWLTARDLLLYHWRGKYNWDLFKDEVIKSLGSYLVHCYEPQDRADVWCRVEKELGIRSTYE